MANYLIIESREPDEVFDSTELSDWILGLRLRGHDVTVFLTQNAVIAARPKTAYARALQPLLDNQVKMVVDEFYATEKSIDQYLDGLEPSSMDQLVDLILADNTRTVWH